MTNENGTDLIEQGIGVIGPDQEITGERLTHELSRLKANIFETIEGLDGYKDALVVNNRKGVHGGASARDTRFVVNGMRLGLLVDNGHEGMSGPTGNSSDKDVMQLTVYSQVDPKLVVKQAVVEIPNNKRPTRFRGRFSYFPKDEPTEDSVDGIDGEKIKPFDNTLRSSVRINEMLEEIKTVASSGNDLE